ncbi:S-layer homology domain-containing protein [Paenibacillus aestuarii]|uniref:S-layer homology domain-containing protein n=1 Tax=Paenibacillus aestuarii TaxID=516965 RepID=A0ABW0K7S0_9BACL|nr:S-layer homology domain-containing protein [Paenibacillus aestuarii]
MAQRFFQLTPFKGAAALLALAACIQASPIQAQTTNLTPQVKLTIPASMVNIGQTTVIPVVVKPEEGIASYNLELHFDPNALEIVAITPKYGNADTAACKDAAEGCFQSGFDNTEGWLRAIWVDMSSGNHLIAAEQTLFEVTVRAKSTSTIGDQSLTLDESNPEQLTFTNAVFQGNATQTLSVSKTIGTLTVSRNDKSRSEQSTAALGGAATATPGGIAVYLDGKEQPQSATAVTSKANNQTVTTVSVDNDKVAEQVEKNGMHTLLLPVNSEGSDAVVAVLNGKLVKAMEGKDAIIQIQTGKVTYTLPASEIRIDAVSQAMGHNVSLEDIKINMKITDTAAEVVQAAEHKAADGQMNIIAKPVDFDLEATYGDHKEIIREFNRYIERSIALPDDVDPSKITTGVTIGSDGSLIHVPTKVHVENGKYYADINSLTNSSYTVIWNPKTFKDVENHWSRKDVNDLASRLIVQGTSDDQFTPDRSVTRAEFTAMVLRALGLHQPAAGSQASFRDVASGDWFKEAIDTGLSYQLISGYEDGTFQPNATITREEAMNVIARAMKLAQISTYVNAADMETLLGGYSDRDQLDEWAKQAAASALKQGIVEGSDGQLTPNAPVTRAQTAAMLHRLLVKADLINP